MTFSGKKVTGDLKLSSLNEVANGYMARVVLVSPNVRYSSRRVCFM